MIRLAIVEDDPLFAEQMRKVIDRYQDETGQLFSVRHFADGEDILENFRADYDIILMDIQMRFMDGMTAAKFIREKDANVIIMFVTSMTSYAIKGYEVGALDYILKPIDDHIMAQKLKRAIDHLRRRDEKFLMVAVEDGVRKINAAHLYYIESQRHVMIYHTSDGVFEGKGRLDDLERELAPCGFCRSNKGYLVNMNFVDGVQDNFCLIAGEKLLISRRKKAAFMEQLTTIL